MTGSDGQPFGFEERRYPERYSMEELCRYFVGVQGGSRR